MRIAEEMDVKLAVFDIEAMLELFDVGIYNPDTGKWDEFQVSAYRNDLYAFIKYYLAGQYDYWVSYNGVGYDHQVLQYVLENYKDWHSLDNLEITRKISEFSSKIIDDGRYDIQPPYKESDFPVKAIDVFRIHHFDNEHKRTSLKWCEFMMNMDVEEMPIHFLKEALTEEEVEMTRQYRCHDVLATYELLKLTIGQTDIPELADYKGKNKIQDRIDVIKETGMECLNWSDVKIGEEWNKLDYKKVERVEKDGYLFPKDVQQPFGKRFKKYFPESAQYSTKHLQEFKEMLGNEYIKNKKQKFPIKVGNTTYTVAKGGIHSNEGPRAITTPPGWFTRDADVAAQYPNAARKWRICPSHLNPETMHFIICDKIDRRVKYKDLAKSLKEQGKAAEARPYMSIQETLKLCLNGGLYGKLNQPGSFLQHPEGAMTITIGCQMEILLLIEMMESGGIHVISGNTDGIVCQFPESKRAEYEAVCKEWEEKVGNTLLGNLEYTEFEGMWQENINHYIAKKIDGSVKKKGRFVTVYGSGGCGMDKNKSKRIIAMALEQYFIHGVSPVEYIPKHTNIFDFCVAKKAFGDLHYEEIIDEDTTIKHKKLIRYYASKSGNVIMKRGKDQNGDAMNNHCEATDKNFFWMGQPRLKYFNKVVTYDDFSKYEVDYPFYILETLKRIDKIEHTDKAKHYANQFKTIQTSMF